MENLKIAVFSMQAFSMTSHVTVLTFAVCFAILRTCCNGLLYSGLFSDLRRLLRAIEDYVFLFKKLLQFA
jgi:hypothetical protein